MEQPNEIALKRKLDFDQYGRHAFIREIINANRSAALGEKHSFRILDVGGRGNILQSLLPNDAVFYLDPLVETNDPNYVAGDGCAIPLDDESFDWVVSADTFEHIPSPQRDAFLSENLRVARIGMILVAPFYSREAQLAELQANEHFQTLTGREHPWLKEHIENGLPTEEEVVSFAKKQRCAVQRFGNNRLSLWELCIVGSFIAGENLYDGIAEECEEFNLFYNTHLFPTDTVEPTYRKVFFLQKQKGLRQYTPPAEPLDVRTELQLLNKYLQLLSHILAIKKQINSQTKAQLTDVNDSLTKVHEELHQSQLQHAVKDIDIHALNKSIEKLNEDIHALHAVLSEKNREISTVHHILNLKDEQVQHKDQEIGGLHQRIHQKQIQIAQKDAALAQKDAALAQKDNRVHALDLALHQKHLEVVHAQQVVNQKQEEINVMASSKFWKLRGKYLALKQLRPTAIVDVGARGFGVLKREGPLTFFSYLGKYIIHGRDYFKKNRQDVPDEAYQVWISKYEAWDFEAINKDISAFTYVPKISIITPVYNVEPKWLNECIESVRSQYYQNWELCLYDDASTRKDTRRCLKKWQHIDPRILVRFGTENKHIAHASNEALKMATGEYVTLLDNDDTISPDALYRVARKLNAEPLLDFIYSDEDKIDTDGKRISPFFKPDWSPDFFLSMMYTSHLGVYRKTIIDAIGGFREGFEGSQDYDLVLRVIEHTHAERIGHIPRILYHWRQVPGSTSMGVHRKNYAQKNSVRALKEYLSRNKIQATVHEMATPGRFRVQYAIIGTPLVSIIIPFQDQAAALKTCVNSILKKTEYRHFELLLVNNQSVEKDTAQYLASLKKQSRIRILSYDKPFNYSAINNFAATQARGEYLVLLNNDTEVITNEWLSAMLEHVQRPQVGIAGAKLLYPNSTLQHAGVVLGLGGVAGHAFKYFPADHEGYFNKLKVVNNYSAVTGACLMIKKDLYEKVGGLDDAQLPVAFNDVDLCLKVRELGYRIVWTPYAALYHYESLTRGNDDELRAQHPMKFQRVVTEREYMAIRWKKWIANDPYYNINLIRDREDYSIDLLRGNIDI